MNNNQKATKRALLTSVMALVMCVVMLVGTTFAWFTDTASTAVNKIQAGNLKVDIVDEDGKSVAKGSTKRALDFVSAGEGDAVRKGETILWEPNCTYLTEGFQIKNGGNLALKWKVEINKDRVTNSVVGGEVTPSKSLLEVIDFSIVDASGNTVDIDNFTGHIRPAAGSDANTGLSGVYKIKAHMDANAGNDYQNLTLDGITITVYATQDTVENDSFNNQYDKYAQYGERTVKNEAPVVGTNGIYGLVDSGRDNINTKNVTYSIPAGNYDGKFYSQHFGINSTFDGNGSTFTGKFELNCGYVPTTEESTLVVSNLNVNGDLIITASSNNVIINNCNAQHISVLKISDDTKVIIDGCTVSGVGMDNPSGNNKYGIYITRNSNGGTADVEIINSNISNIKASAIVVNGGTDTSQTATNFTIKGNTFSKYGLDGKLDNKRAAFLIYNDTVLAPTSQQNETVKTMTEAAKALGDSIRADNKFLTDIPGTAVIANFFFATVDF